jgi:TonB-linked SusC/RagA family outer membrane protein
MKKIRLLLCLCACTGVLSAQELHISGRVTGSDSGEPLAGATVQLKNSATAVTTDSSGSYAITVPAKGAVITVSFTGMNPVERAVGEAGVMDFVLTPASGSMNEVVVIGYGRQSKRQVTTAVSTVSAKTIESLPTYRVEQALQGTAPGVTVIQNSGSPGAALTIRVRGTGTAGTAQPLFIVDGMQVPDLNYLDPSDIDNISILKDAASAAIYGARGGNGVVLVQTKTGRKANGKPVISLNGYYGIQDLGKKPDLMDRDQYVAYYNQYAGSTGGTPISDADRLKLPNTNWYDAVFEKHVPTYNGNISVAGGGERYAYYLSGGDFSQKGLAGGKENKSTYNRRNIKFNFEADVFRNLNIKVGVDLVGSTRHYLYENQAGTGFALLNFVNSLPPVYPAFDPADKSIPFNPGDLSNPITVNGVTLPAVGGITNPFLALLISNNKTTSNISVYNIAGTWKPIANLEIFSSYAYYRDLSLDKNFVPSYDFRPSQNFFNQYSSYTETNYESSYRQWEGNARYRFNWSAQKLELLAGFSVLQSAGSSVSKSGTDFFVNDFDKINFALIKDPSTIVNGAPSAYETGLLSYYGRVSYSYKDKYLLAGTLRSDASSLFGPENRTGFFPSLSAGWLASEESFLKDARFINLLKLRASWGINGNNFINPYQYSTIVNANAGPSFNGQNTPGISVPYLANPSVKWEQAAQSDIGIDLNVLDNRLGFSMDYYIKKNSDVLVPIGTPVYTGYSSAAANIADVKNSGLEISAIYNSNRKKAFTWNLGFHIGFNKNEVTSLGLDGQPINGGSIIFVFPDPITRTDVGHPIASFYGYRMDHIDQNGDFVFKDLDGQPGITEKDKTFIGSPFPRFTYGITLGAAFKGFDLSGFLYGSQGNKIYDATVRLDASFTNRPVGYGEPGAPRNLLGSGASGTAQTDVSDYYLRDGSFAKLKTLSLGYTFPKSFLRYIGLSEIRLYLTGQNLFVITKYPGADPEIGQASAQNPLDVGIDRGYYPQPRLLLFGLQAKF